MATDQPHSFYAIVHPYSAEYLPTHSLTYYQASWPVSTTSSQDSSDGDLLTEQMMDDRTTADTPFPYHPALAVASAQGIGAQAITISSATSVPRLSGTVSEAIIARHMPTLSTMSLPPQGSPVPRPFAHLREHRVQFQEDPTPRYVYLDVERPVFTNQQEASAWLTNAIDEFLQAYAQWTPKYGEAIMYIGLTKSTRVRRALTQPDEVLKPGHIVHCYGELHGKWRVTDRYFLRKQRIYVAWEDDERRQVTHVEARRSQVKMPLKWAERASVAMWELFELRRF
ncbi:hypothetical protein DFH07DRAFT_780054 [Mycena maculata]|uniref:Uncharacterized protein n=1 Tax=Mycena maculata TaxID=230809 RepID=A0AAD7MW51_9AGAR|nr:hypothetical protein DFH07DRAFT_780054 [Mycena maculata]